MKIVGARRGSRRASAVQLAERHLDFVVRVETRRVQPTVANATPAPVVNQKVASTKPVRSTGNPPTNGPKNAIAYATVNASAGTAGYTHIVGSLLGARVPAVS